VALVEVQDVIGLPYQLFCQIDEFGIGIRTAGGEVEKTVHIAPETASFSRFDRRSVQAGYDDQVPLFELDVCVPLRRQVSGRLVAVDPRNDEQRRPLLSSLDGMDGQFLPGCLKVGPGLRFRDRSSLLGGQIVKPEAENEEHRDG
jgi:hypothetical protein